MLEPPPQPLEPNLTYTPAFGVFIDNQLFIIYPYFKIVVEGDTGGQSIVDDIRGSKLIANAVGCNDRNNKVQSLSDIGGVDVNTNASNIDVLTPIIPIRLLVLINDGYIGSYGVDGNCRTERAGNIIVTIGQILEHNGGRFSCNSIAILGEQSFISCQPCTDSLSRCICLDGDILNTFNNGRGKNKRIKRILGVGKSGK